MLIRLNALRRIIREALREQAWMPGRYYPGSEPLSGEDVDRLGEEEELDEVDTDPTNNPGRPADAFDYLGMHPDPKAAMSHPFSGGGGSGAAPASPPDATSPPEPTEE